MLLVIEIGQLSKEFETDIRRLGRNPHLTVILDSEERCFSRAALVAPVVTPLEPGEPLIVLAHSGYRDDDGRRGPWIGGRAFPDFAADLISKFTADGLSGRELYFVTCDTGPSALRLAGDLAAAGVRCTQLYLPRGLVFVSSNGIPHGLTGYACAEAADQDVARYDAEYAKLVAHALVPGQDVAGAEITAAGATAWIDAGEVEWTIAAFFDPDSKEI
jgi:hypothetical protein